MMEGSETGAFSGDFMVRAGGFRLMWFILHGLLTQNWSLTRKPALFTWQLIVDSQTEEIGFLKISDTHLSIGIRDLELLSVRSDYRNRGVGTAVIHRLVADLPKSAQLRVHCTKYARAMQHILKRNSFKRNPKILVPKLEGYLSVNGSL
jgi:GNAT superfamily N-acetyltransferase